jgi:hypothetical protein
MLNTTLRCSRRSSMAAATMGSSKIFPHEPVPRFVVKQMLAFRYRWVITWKSAAAASEASGR